MNLLDILKRSNEHIEYRLRMLDHIHFADGHYSLSVQASEYHYCMPRQTLPLDKYTHFEVMAKIPKYDVPKNWIDLYDTGGSDVYAYVPVSEIEKLIDILDKKYKMV